MKGESEELCAVCGKPLDGIYSVTCMSCGRKIHLPAVETSENTCGFIVTQLHACALAFLCKNCSAVQKTFNDVKANP